MAREIERYCTNWVIFTILKILQRIVIAKSKSYNKIRLHRKVIHIKSKTLIVWQITRCIFSLKDHGKEGQYSGKAVWMSAGLENREMGIQNGGGKVREKDDHLQSAVSDR